MFPFFQALVRLYLDLHEKYSSGVLREELKYSDVIGTIDLLVDQFSTSMTLLKTRPVSHFIYAFAFALCKFFSSAL